MNKRTHIKRTNEIKNKILESLKSSMGNVSFACKAAGICRTTFYEWVKEDDELAQAVKDINGDCGDWVESRLLQKIKDGDTTAIIFYCKTRLKNRGYTERQEITGRDGNALQISFNNDSTAKALKMAIER